MNRFESTGNTLLAAHDGCLMLARILGKAVLIGTERLRRMGRTYVELAQFAATAKLRTWC